MNEQTVTDIARALNCEPYLARAMMKTLKEEGYRIVRAPAPKVPCVWRRSQMRADHGELSDYGRRCDLDTGHDGPHRTPKAAKQANSGVWFNPVTGETVTQ